MNVACPEEAGSNEYVEKPILEQVVLKFMDDLTISSEVSGLYSFLDHQVSLCWCMYRSPRLEFHVYR
ncbi:Adenylyl cyclase-associated protein [Phytophthora cinnamomi]|uniref:Adenylyl cyclase-associated protein n=1 Tax=Phytophthora cinnamomi TaxID=4785 RepID=UPI00355A6232|nr:Adenylyl cyclase-associated protein [Phytophthora cinnamomi]